MIISLLTDFKLIGFIEVTPQFKTLAPKADYLRPISEKHVAERTHIYFLELIFIKYIFLIINL